MNLTQEQINQKLEEARQQVRDPNYKPPTLEGIKAQLLAGEITQEQYDRIDVLYQLSPEARERTRREFSDARFKIDPDNLTRWK